MMWKNGPNNGVQKLNSLKAMKLIGRSFYRTSPTNSRPPFLPFRAMWTLYWTGLWTDPEVGKKFLENAARNVDRMVNLVNDLDEISRLESGEQPLYKEQFVIQDLIREVYESLSIKTSKRNIKTSIKKGCEQPINVFADKEKIRQVVINIVSNATKYGKADGTIVSGIYQDRWPDMY
jgi:two-component system phosphate regulon sensor histidine kinase PhoR